MPYQVSRNGQLYGPYTLEDLQRYVASGNVLLSDVAKSDDDPSAIWVPVSSLIGGAQFLPSGYPPVAADYSAAAVYPSAPNLNWGLLLLLDFFTCGIFQVIWNLIIAAWARRIQPASKALIFYIVALVFAFANLGTSMGNVLAAIRHESVHQNPIGIIFGIAYWVIRLIARFNLRDTLEQHYNTAEPLGVRFSAVMTFFFGGIYFQYKLNEIQRLKEALRYRAPY